MAAEKKAKEDRKNSNEDRKAATREEALYSGMLSGFEREQEDYYSQLGRQRKQRGLDTFRQFSTVNQFSPGFSDNSPGVVLPDKANIANTIDTAMRQDMANQEAINSMNPQGGGPKKQNALQRRLDPLKMF